MSKANKKRRRETNESDLASTRSSTSSTSSNNNSKSKTIESAKKVLKDRIDCKISSKRDDKKAKSNSNNNNDDDDDDDENDAKSNKIMAKNKKNSSSSKSSSSSQKKKVTSDEEKIVKKDIVNDANVYTDSVKLKYPNLTDWYFNNVMKGDTPHPFLDYLPEKIRKEISAKAAKDIFKALHNPNGCFSEAIAFRSPWSGYVKYFSRIIDACDFNDFMDETILRDDSFKDAFVAAGGIVNRHVFCLDFDD
jgi:hypothetical protein